MALLLITWPHACHRCGRRYLLYTHVTELVNVRITPGVQEGTR